MRALWITTPLSLAIAAFGIYLANARPPVAIYSDQFQNSISTRHPVTDEMRKLAEQMAKTPVPNFSELDSKGQALRSDMLKEGKPAVLVFIKNECPCSVEAQPIFNSMAKAYGSDALFYGISDCDQRDADAYVEATKTNFPVICDTDSSTIHAFQIKASASMALVDGKGRIVEIFPGYSISELRRLNLLLGSLAGVDPKEFDDSKAPVQLTAGCTFE